MPRSTNLQWVLKMGTRVVHVTDESTVFALAERKFGKTLRALAAELDLPPKSIATLSDVLRFRPSALTESSENDLRLRLGLPTIISVRVRVCPTCGGDHGLKQIPDCADERVTLRNVPRSSGQIDIRPRLPIDPALRIAKLSALLRQAEAELTSGGKHDR
jgi:hypothetical protein